jgi:hypothetical protein
MEWFGDRHSGDLGTDLFGEKNALLDGLGGEIDPSVGTRTFLNIIVFPLPLFLSDDLWARLSSAREDR